MTTIPYIDKTWELTAGCSKKNVGCKNCYAVNLAARFQAKGLLGYDGIVKDDNWTGRVNTLARNLGKPLHWREPMRVFVNSRSDLFHEKVDADYIDGAITMMHAANQHAYLVFTKRFGRAANILAQWGQLPNAWIIFSISNQEIADFARPYLEQIASWGWNTGISFEPALGMVNWDGWEFIKWMVCGAESGARRWPFDVEWMQAAYHWAFMNCVPFYAKQDGAFKPGQQGRIPDWLWNTKDVIPLPGEIA